MIDVVADAETRAVVDLKAHGAHVYAEHPLTRVLCVGFVRADRLDERELWVASPSPDPDDPLHGVPPAASEGLPFPVYRDRQIPPLLQAIIDGRARPVAHNASFEISIWPILCRIYGIPSIDPARWICTMTRAALAGAPGALERACAALDLEHRKNMAGHHAMLRLCKPREARKDADASRIYWRDDPADHRVNYIYAIEDCVAEAALLRATPDPSPAEAATIRLDREINMRGVRIDVEAARGAEAIAKQELARLNRQVKRMTGGMIGTLNQRDKILAWCRLQGVELEGLRARDVREALTDDQAESGDVDVIDGALEMEGQVMPDSVRSVLELRSEANKASASKFRAMVNRASADGRVYWALAYHSAFRTGRWAGRGIQPHNDPRDNPPDEVSEDVWFDALATGDVEYFSSLLPTVKDYRGQDARMSVMQGLKCSVRGMKLPAEGRLYVAPDLAQIEARFLAWAADQIDVVDNFREYDRRKAAAGIEIAQGVSPDRAVELKNWIDDCDIYTVTGKKMHAGRQQGKVGVLSCFAADTPVVVLLPSGAVAIKPIASVNSRDMVWDGVQWVHTEGAVERGCRETMKLAGLSVTEDHLIWSGTTWIPANSVDISTLRSASETASASLWWLDFGWASAAASTAKKFKFSAPAERQSTTSICPICEPVYDLLNCGPRSRFTVMGCDRDGNLLPLIVHNCGYGSGKFALALFALNYGMKLDEREAQAIVSGWRQANPMIVLLWSAEEDAAIEAIQFPDRTVSRGKLGAYRFDSRTGNLVRRMPCGDRYLVYRKARIEMCTPPWGGPTKATITYEMNIFAKGQPGVFARTKTRGAKLVADLVQGSCRDLLRDGMLRTARAGIPITFHVHDEEVAEVRAELAKEASDTMVACMTQTPAWAPGLPITSSADILTRYRKA